MNDKASLFWTTDKRWFCINDANHFELTDQAPSAARESFKLWSRGLSVGDMCRVRYIGSDNNVFESGKAYTARIEGLDQLIIDDGTRTHTCSSVEFIIETGKLNKRQLTSAIQYEEVRPRVEAHINIMKTLYSGNTVHCPECESGYISRVAQNAFVCNNPDCNYRIIEN